MELIIGRDASTSQLRITMGQQSKTFGSAGCVPMTVSRQHCSLTINPDGSYRITNLKPQNVTFVNGVEIMVKTIMEKDKIELGPSKFLVSWDWIKSFVPQMVDFRPLQRVWVYFDNTHPEVRQESKDKTQNAADKATWKKVAVSGAAGILLGASAMYATDAFAANTEETPDTKPEGENPSQDAAATNDNASIKVAESHDEQSFKEAFDAARAEVGPGGAFHWHGNIYSTYTEDEWNNMTDAEKNDYAQAVKPEVRAEEMNAAPHQTEDVAVVSHSSHADQDVSVAHNDANLHQASDVQVADDQNADVHLVNAGEVQLADGSMATVGVFDVDGQEVSVVDFDQDGNPDVAICDANGNGSIDVGEAVDLHTGQVITPSGSDFADAGVDDSADSNLQTASLENPDVAPDMPDYMSDADIQMA